MITIALRFSDNFAPSEGTIAEHRKLISEKGYVWYGKLGSTVSDKVCSEILSNNMPRILLIHSGKQSRYWAFVDQIIKETPPLEEIPAYYRDQTDKFRTWFRVTRIETADKNVMSACSVASSGLMLSLASRRSMSPYFIITCEEASDGND